MLLCRFFIHVRAQLVFTTTVQYDCYGWQFFSILSLYPLSKRLFAQTCILIMLFLQRFKQILHDLLNTLSLSVSLSLGSESLQIYAVCTSHISHITYYTLKLKQNTHAEAMFLCFPSTSFSFLSLGCELVCCDIKQFS